MKKLVSVIIAALMAATMSTAAMAVETVYPEGGPTTAFNSETADKDVSVGFAYDDDGNITVIEDWVLEDGYAVNITWSALSFLYVIDDEGSAVTGKYVSRWDPDQLMWVIIDTETGKPVDGPLEGDYDDSLLLDFADIGTVTVKSIAEAVTDRSLGVNGLAVTNRSSQGISVAYKYNQIKPLYANPGDALEAKTANIPAVYGQVGGNDSEATLSTSYNFLKLPTNPPSAPGVCGTITITIG